MFLCIVQNRKRAAAARKSEQAGQAKTIYFAPQVDRTTKDTRQGRSAAQERGQRLSNVVGSTPGAKPVNRQDLPYHSPPFSGNKKGLVRIRCKQIRQAPFNYFNFL